MDGPDVRVGARPDDEDHQPGCPCAAGAAAVASSGCDATVVVVVAVAVAAVAVPGSVAEACCANDCVRSTADTRT